MAKPHKTLSKTESAIQLGNILKYGAGGGTKKGLIAKAKKLLKIGEKATKSSEPIKEINKSVFKRAKVGKSLRTAFNLKENPAKPKVGSAAYKERSTAKKSRTLNKYLKVREGHAKTNKIKEIKVSKKSLKNQKVKDKKWVKHHRKP